MSASLDDLIDELDINIMNVTIQQVQLARQAYRAFGKGSGHPAKLNFGDCFSHALAILAIDLKEPLLFKGDDFNHTDVRMAFSPTT